MAPGMAGEVIPVLISSDSILPVSQDIHADVEMGRPLVLGLEEGVQRGTVSGWTLCMKC